MKRVFLVGAARSGTTLLQSRLVIAGQIVSLQETAYFSTLFGLTRSRTFGDGKLAFTDRCKQHIRRQWGIGARSRRAYKRIEQVAERSGHKLDSSFSPRPLVRHAVDDFINLLDRITEKSGVEAWLEKSPAHTYFIPEIERYVPDALFVHIIRRGEDVVASNIDAARKYQSGGHSFHDNLDISINRWNNAIRDEISYLGKDNHFFLLYDCLIEYKQAAVQRILDYLGIPNRDTADHTGPEPTDGIVAEGERWKSGIRTEIIQPEKKFHTVLDEDERRYVLERLTNLEPFLAFRGKNVFNRMEQP